MLDFEWMIIMISLLTSNLSESCAISHKRSATALRSLSNPEVSFVRHGGIKHSTVDGMSVLKDRDALVRLYQNANFITAPVLYPHVFKQWLMEVSSRKMTTDVEFSERIKLRELKRLHIDIIRKVEAELEVSRINYASCGAFDVLEQLDREITNGK